MKIQRGFTIIEMIVYIAIFGIMMTGAVGAVYALAGSDARNQTKAMVQEEGSFLIGKIDWALSGAQTISSPTANTSDNTLTVTRYDSSASPVVIAVAGGNITITVGSNATHILNNSNVQIDCPTQGCFTHTSASADGINPENATSSLAISAKTAEGLLFSQFFSTVKYLRK